MRLRDCKQRFFAPTSFGRLVGRPEPSKPPASRTIPIAARLSLCTCFHCGNAKGQAW